MRYHWKHSRSMALREVVRKVIAHVWAPVNQNEISSITSAPDKFSCGITREMLQLPYVYCRFFFPTYILLYHRYAGRDDRLQQLPVSAGVVFPPVGGWTFARHSARHKDRLVLQSRMPGKWQFTILHLCKAQNQHVSSRLRQWGMSVRPNFSPRMSWSSHM